MATRILAALAAANLRAAWAASSEPNMLTVTGACDVQEGIDGETFIKQGYTLSGAPYYKAIDSELYMFYDPDCMESTDGTPRWIIDRDRPSLTRTHDLDGDGFCDYVARIDSEDKRRPPTQATWTLQCAGRLEQRYIILLEGPQTSGQPTQRPATSTTRPRAGVSTTRDEGDGNVQNSPSPAPGSRARWSLGGACGLKGFLNGLVFEEVGETADGRPFFKALGTQEYIYYDADCDAAGSTNVGRWVLDRSAPSVVATRDLDEDGKCDYHARVDGDAWYPPLDATWRMYCGAAQGGWVDVPLTLRTASSAAAGGGTTTAPRAAVSAAPTTAPLALAALAAVLALVSAA